MAETNTSPAVTVQDVISNKRDFLSLDFTMAQEREVALASMDQLQILARRLDTANPVHLDLLKAWIKKKHENILALTTEQRCKELIDIYIEAKFKKKIQDLEKEKNPANPLAKQVSMIHSYTKELLICYNYETKEGETVSYFDSMLGIPVKLATEASIKLKILDSLTLVKKIDVELDIVDLTMVVDMINNVIADGLRATMLEVVDKAKVSYYDIPKCYVVIKDALCKKVQSVFETYGLYVADLKINEIYMTNDIDDQLAKQYFALAKLARIKEFEHKQEEQSLLLYEKKAKIQAAYPDLQLGLTEAEKDLALERYLKRKDKSKELTVKVNEEKLGERIDVDTSLSELTMNGPKAPDPLKINNTHRTVFAIIAAIWAALFSVMFAIELTITAIIILVVGLVVLVGMGILFRYQLRYGVTKTEKEAYERQLDAYNQYMNETANGGANKKADAPVAAEAVNDTDVA